jgi:hypothetical protein
MTYLSTSDVAARLSISADQVCGLIASGALSAVNIALPGKLKPRWRISEANLGAFLAAAAAKPTTRRRARKVKQPEVIEFF